MSIYATKDRAGSGGKKREESKIPIELDGFYKKGGWQEPLEDTHHVRGNNVLNNVTLLQNVLKGKI